MNEHQIECFLQVTEAGSFSKAAANMHITQPAITHQIAMLEKELDVTLFQRISRGVHLTAAGNSFLPAAQNLKDAFRKAHASIKKVFDEHTPFTLGMPRAMMLNTEIYRKLMIHLSEELPSIAFSVCEIVGDADCYDDLKNGIDCIITMDLGSSMKNRHEMQSVPLFRNRCGIAIGKKNPLCSRDIVTVDDLLPYEICYAQYDRHFVTEVKNHLIKGNLLRLRESPTLLTTVHELISGRSVVMMPGESSELDVDHIAVLHTDREMPVTCAFYLKTNTDSIYETVVKIIQRSHIGW